MLNRRLMDVPETVPNLYLYVTVGIAMLIAMLLLWRLERAAHGRSER
jgi:hypothetical protein